jgi:hypothetical protein
LTHGAVKQCGNDQRALFACKSGLSEPEIGLEHAFVLLIWAKEHVKWHDSHGARFAKTTANCSKLFLSLSFDLTCAPSPSGYARVPRSAM